MVREKRHFRVAWNSKTNFRMKSVLKSKEFCEKRGRLQQGCAHLKPADGRHHLKTRCQSL